MKIEWKTCFKVAASLFLLYLCIFYWPGVSSFLGAILQAAMPLLIGCMVAYLVNILMAAYEKLFFPGNRHRFIQKSRRPLCLITAYLTLIAIVVLVAALIVPQLISCVQLMIAELPGLIKTGVAKLDEWNLIPENIVETLKSIDWGSRIGQILQTLSTGVGNIVSLLIGTVTSLFSGLVTALLSVIFSIYLLADRDRLKRRFSQILQRILKKERFESTMHVLSITHDCFRRFIIGQCTEALILGLLCMVGMWILRLPYATMIGALIAFTALIPVAGAYIGAAAGALMILTVSPIKALIFLIFLIILQQLEGNLIYPRVVGSSIGLPGIWVLAAVTLAGGVMGVMGMLLGVPLAATAYRLLGEKLPEEPHAEPLPISETVPAKPSDKPRHTTHPRKKKKKRTK